MWWPSPDSMTSARPGAHRVSRARPWPCGTCSAGRALWLTWRWSEEACRAGRPISGRCAVTRSRPRESAESSSSAPRPACGGACCTAPATIPATALTTGSCERTDPRSQLRVRSLRRSGDCAPASPSRLCPGETGWGNDEDRYHETRDSCSATAAGHAGGALRAGPVGGARYLWTRDRAAGCADDHGHAHYHSDGDHRAAHPRADADRGGGMDIHSYGIRDVYGYSGGGDPHRVCSDRCAVPGLLLPDHRARALT